MEQAEDLLQRLDAQHNDILKQIDDLDNMITNILLDWSTPMKTNDSSEESQT